MEKTFVFNSWERRLLIESLNHCRTKILNENKPAQDVNEMFFKVIKARSNFFFNRDVYKIKMKDFDYRVLIAVTNDYKQYQKTSGNDTTEINRLLLKILDAYGV